MKIVVTSQGTNLDSPVDPRFGRAKHFLLVDTDTMQTTAHDNAQNLNAPQGAESRPRKRSTTLARRGCHGQRWPEGVCNAARRGNCRLSRCLGDCPGGRRAVSDGPAQLAESANVEGHWA